MTKAHGLDRGLSSLDHFVVDAFRRDVILRRAKGTPRDRTSLCTIPAVEKTRNAVCSVCSPIDFSSAARRHKVPHAGFAAVQDDNTHNWRKNLFEELRASRELMVAACLGDPVLTDLVQECFVANLKNDGCLLAVPVGLLERASDGLSLSLILGRTSQGF